jgi:ATP-binding cassette subfamily B protein
MSAVSAINKKELKSHWRWFFRLWKDHKADCLFLIFMTSLSTGVAIFFPYFFKYLIDTLSVEMELLSGGEMLVLRNKILSILLLLGFVKFISGLYPLFRARMNLIFEQEVRERYFSRLLDKEYRFFSNFRTGDLVTRFTDDLSGFPKISWFACSGFFRAFDALAVVSCCIIMMFWMNWKLAIISLLPLPLALLMYLKVSGCMSEAYDRNQKAVSETNNHLESCFSGIRILQAYNATDRESGRFNEVLKRRMGVEMDVVRLSGRLHIFFEFVGHFAQVLVVLAGGLFVINNKLSLGEYYAFFTYLSIIVYPMLDIPNLFVTSRQAFVCVERLEEIRRFEDPMPVADGSSAGSVDALDSVDSIEFRNVDFSFGGQKTGKTAGFALRDVNFKVKKGEKVAIVGKIGSGKTSLLNLLSLIYTPDAGEILVNGRPVSDFDPVLYRSRLGYIVQEPVVFSETVAQNIRFFREFSLSSVERAADLSQFSAEVNELPQKYEEKLGQRGVNISGGQKQRLTIARAIIGRPQVLLMDDVTASLDAENEDRFWNEIKREIGDVTAVVVTHRLATARRADRLIVLNDGEIEDSGTFSEMLQRSATLRSMVQEDS